MKKALLKITLLLIVVLLVLPMAACDNKPTLPSESENESGSVASEDPGTFTMKETETGFEIPDLTLTNKTIKWVGIDQPQFREDAVVTNFFKKYYDGAIEMDVTASAEIVTKMTSLVLSGTPPDLVGISGGFPSLPISDLVEPIDGLINFDDELFVDLKDCYEQFVYGDKHYFVPWVYDALSMVFYNTQIFEDNGMKTPAELFEEGNWTWDEMRNIALDLTIDEDGDGVAERWGLATCVWHDIRIAFTTGENLVKVNGTEIESNLGSSKIESAFNFLYDLTYKDKVASPSRDPNEVANLLNTGKAAMLMGPDFWGGDSSTMKDLKQANKLGFAPYPKDPSADRHYIPGEAIGFYVPKGVDNDTTLTAFFYSCVAAMAEQGIEGHPAYEKGYEETMKVFGDSMTREEFKARAELAKKINQLPRIVDSYRDLMDLDTMYNEMIGVQGGTPLTYKAVVAKLEPGVNDIIANLYITE